MNRTTWFERLGLLALVLFSPLLTNAQHDHKLESNSPYERFQKPQVKYQIQAELFPREGLIKGWMDVDWTNRSDDTLESICLDFGFSPYDDTTLFDFHSGSYSTITKTSLTGNRPNYFWLDSVLYQASRLGQPARMRNSFLMEIPLPVPILPGGSGPLIVMFETRFKPTSDTPGLDSAWRAIPDWFPQVAHYLNGEWQSTRLLEATDDRPMASFAISLKVDSSFNIIGPGELLNEKEHFGTLTLPEGDTIAVDVTSFLYAYNPDNPYRPKFDKGIKSYHFRLLNGNNFPIFLTSELRMDRAMVDQQLVEVIYPPEVAPAWRERVGTEARTVVGDLSAKLGRYPYPVLRVVALGEGESGFGARELIGLSKRLSGNSDIRNALTVLIARSWLADCIASTASDSSAIEGFFAFDEALALILTEDLKSGWVGSGTIGPAEMASNTIASWTMSTPLWIDRVKARLNDFVLDVGQDKFIAVVSDISSRHRFQVITESEFKRLIEKRCGQNALELFNRPQSGRTNKGLNLHRTKAEGQ